MGEDILKRLGDILKDDHNAFTRATAIAAQAEIMRLEERSKGLRRERDTLRAELAAEREGSQKWIAKASEDWPEALDEIERLRAELARLKRYEAAVKLIANSYVELSHDKVMNEYLHIIRRCRKLVEDDWVEPDYVGKTAKDDL